jgi:prophage regulatory protein
MTTLLRLDAVLERRGRSRSQLYREVQLGLCPAPIRPQGTKIACWPSDEIDAVNQAEIAGASPDEIRSLVRELVAQRTAGRQQTAPATAAA